MTSINIPIARRRLAHLLDCKKSLLEADGDSIIQEMIKYPDITREKLTTTSRFDWRHDARIIATDLALVRTFIDFFVPTENLGDTITLIICLPTEHVRILIGQSSHILEVKITTATLACLRDLQPFVFHNRNKITALSARTRVDEESLDVVNLLQRWCSTLSQLRSFTLGNDSERWLDEKDAVLNLIAKLLTCKYITYINCYRCKLPLDSNIREKIQRNNTLMLFHSDGMQKSDEIFTQYQTSFNLYGKYKARIGSMQDVTKLLSRVNETEYYVDKPSLLFDLLLENVTSWSNYTVIDTSGSKSSAHNFPMPPMKRQCICRIY